MPTNENTPETAPTKHFDALGEDEKKGQMLVIYLPEGSVIVDRTDIDLSKAAPQPIVEKTVTAPIQEQKTSANPEVHPSHATLQEVIQIAVQEVMQNTAKTSAQTEIPTPPSNHHHVPRLTHGIHFPRRRLNWVHGINTLLVTYIILVSVLPAMFASFFGVAIYASKVAHPGASIATGDLMVARQLPARDLKVNDVVLVRDANTWRLDVRQVVSSSRDASTSTLTTASTRGAAINRTLVMSNSSKVYIVSSIVPKLGYVPITLSYTVTKLIGALFILILNLRVHYQRGRRRRLGPPAQPL